MWPFIQRKKATSEAHAAPLPLQFFNTLHRKKEVFTLPAIAHRVRMYNCGPTVYNTQHIGNLSMYVFTDILRKTLEYNGFAVKQVINITDVGHLTSDADEGEDKMSRALKREGLALTLENMRLIADKYAQQFFADLRALNIDTERIEFPRASDYIPAQIAMVQTLMEKGYAYQIKDGVYFDTTRFPSYGELGGIDLAGLKEGARVAAAEGKRHTTDFALWKLDKKIGWDSPWGKGFPGWHLECSAMIRHTLGEVIDIHTGGIEHIPVHHNNEIAQSECATGKKPLSRFWMHRAHVQIEGGKIAKSVGNVVYLSDIAEKGYSALALRYLFLSAHYRSNSNFSWTALEAASTALSRLAAAAQEDDGMPIELYRVRFLERMNDDLDTPGALAVLWEMVRNPALAPCDIAATIRDADRVLGLGLADKTIRDSLSGTAIPVEKLPAEVALLVTAREEARSSKDWKKADELRDQIAEAGYDVKDTAEGPQVTSR